MPTTNKLPAKNIAPALKELAGLLERREELDRRIEMLCNTSVAALRGSVSGTPVSRSRNGYYATLFRQLKPTDQKRIRRIREEQGFDAALAEMQTQARLAAAVALPVDHHDDHS